MLVTLSKCSKSGQISYNIGKIKYVNEQLVNKNLIYFITLCYLITYLKQL